jgi:hypothetical protein
MPCCGTSQEREGATPDNQLGARRRTAGRRSDGRGQLTRTGRASGWAARTTRPAGTTRSAGEARLPRPVHRRAPRATGTPGFVHAVVKAVAVLVVPEDYGAGKEYDRQDENDPGDNHHPRCRRVEPGRLGQWRRRRSCGDGSRMGRGFGCFAHASNIAQTHNRRDTFRQQICCESRRVARRSGERRATSCGFLALPGSPAHPGSTFGVHLVASP